MDAPEDAIRQIAAVLSLQPSVEIVKTIQLNTSMEVMREISAQVGQSSESTIRQGNFMYDKETLLHFEHIRHGGSGYGRQRLTREELEKVSEALAKVIEPAQ